MTTLASAHYHCHYRKFSRAAGKSAVESAAYRLAARLYDERTGKAHNYTFKRGVTDTMVITPSGQAVPAWVHDAARLWNEAEAAEKDNPRALVMHELEIALPQQLNAEQRKAAAADMAQFIVKRYGCIAHLAFHNPNREGDQRNYHVHLMFTTRAITPAGFSKTKFRNYSRRELEARESGLPTGAEEIALVRKQWALIGNRHLQMAGHKPELDHRSYEDQGLDLEPQKHLGPQATAKERRGEHTAKGDFNRAAADRNRRRMAWAKAWEQALIDITVHPLPAPPPRVKKIPSDRDFPEGFLNLMDNQTTERTALIHLHMTEQKALWRAQQELRQSHKKQWARLYRQQRTQRAAFLQQQGGWTRKLLRTLDFTGRLAKSHQQAMADLERRQKIDRARLGQIHRASLRHPAGRLQEKHEQELIAVDASHQEQRREFLTREARNQALRERLKKSSRFRDRDPGRER